MKLSIQQDTDAANPRTEFDNLGTLAHWHRRQNIGEEDFRRRFNDGQAGFAKFVKIERAEWLPVYLYDHSGQRVSTKPFGDPWDSGQVGVIYVTAARIIQEYGDDSPASRAQAREVLAGEITTLDQYLSGDVWGYVLTDDNDNHLDSCWGFYGHKYCEEEGRAALESALTTSFDPCI